MAVRVGDEGLDGLDEESKSSTIPRDLSDPREPFEDDPREDDPRDEDEAKEETYEEAEGEIDGDDEEVACEEEEVEALRREALMFVAVITLLSPDIDLIALAVVVVVDDDWHDTDEEVVITVTMVS